MSKNNTLAQAIYDLYPKHIVELIGFFYLFREVCDIDLELRNFILDPTINISAKLDLLYTIRDRLSMNQVLSDNLLEFIVNKVSPISWLELGDQLSKIHHKTNNTEDLTIYSAKVLSNEQLHAIQQQYGISTSFHTVLDPSLLAGIKIESEDYIIDHSLKTRLSEFKASLN